MPKPCHHLVKTHWTYTTTCHCCASDCDHHIPTLEADSDNGLSYAAFEIAVQKITEPIWRFCKRCQAVTRNLVSYYDSPPGANTDLSHHASPSNLGYSYASKQQTKCAVCGLIKHTPLRRDEMGGYVCLTCIDKRLDELQKIDRALYGEDPLGYIPDRVLSLQTIQSLATAKLVDAIKPIIAACHEITDTDDWRGVAKILVRCSLLMETHPELGPTIKSKPKKD